MKNWRRIKKRIGPEGTTITYGYSNNITDYRIESRRRHIPHANGNSGTWDHTSYFVMKDGVDLVEKWSLKDAKEYVEKLEADND